MNPVDQVAGWRSIADAPAVAWNRAIARSQAVQDGLMNGRTPAVAWVEEQRLAPRVRRQSGPAISLRSQPGYDHRDQ
jgi:hypothetical protein